MFSRRLIILFAIACIVYVSTVLLLGSRTSPISDASLPVPNESISVTNRPSPAVVDYWQRWALVILAAKPMIPHVELRIGAASIMEPHGTPKFGKEEDDRQPTPDQSVLSKADVQSLRRSHAILLEYPGFNETREEALKLFRGTGIVMVAGGRYYAPAIVSIRMLRRTNSTLPVQLYLQSSSEYEPHICEEVLPALNAECFVIEDYLRSDTPFKVTHYQLKVLAILFSSFESLIFLDADCIPLHDPLELLTSEPFLSTGLVSWPDYWIATEDPAFYTIAGFKAYPTGLPLRSSESGQLLISKEKHLSSLLLAAYYNVYGPTHYYPILSQGAPGEGDKDTFLAGAIVLHRSWYRVKEHTGSVGFSDYQGGFHGKGMIQYDAHEEWSLREYTHTAQPRPFFLHANTPKMNVGRLVLGEEKELFMPYAGGAEEPVRLWGPKDKMVSKFDYDVEKVVWEIMVDMACELEGVLRDWKKIKHVCRKARAHWDAVFGEGAQLARNTTETA